MHYFKNIDIICCTDCVFKAWSSSVLLNCNFTAAGSLVLVSQVDCFFFWIASFLLTFEVLTKLEVIIEEVFVFSWSGVTDWNTPRKGTFWP